MIKLKLGIKKGTQKDAIDAIASNVPKYLLIDIYETADGNIMLLLDAPRQEIYNNIISKLKELEFIVAI